MNLLDFKRSLLPMRGYYWGSSEGTNADGNGDSGNSSDGQGAGMGSSAGESGDSTGSDSTGGGGSDYSGFSQAEMDAAAQQSDAQAAENDANNPGSGWGGESFSDVAAQEANRLAAQLDAANPNKSAVNTMDALMGVSAGFGTMDVDNRSINDGFGGGWSLGVADRMSDLGYGDREGLNANNTTQSAAQISASSFVNDKVMPAVTGLITAAVPGAGLAMSGMRAAGSVTSGQKSLTDAVKDFAIDYGASRLAGAINSKVGSAIGPENMAGLGLISSASKAFGGPGMPNIGASIVGGAMNVAGISKSTGSGFTSQNNPAADNGFTAPGTNYGGNNANDMGAPSITTPTTPTPTDFLGSGLDMNLWGSIDGSGWRAAKQKYSNSKRT